MDARSKGGLQRRLVEGPSCDTREGDWILKSIFDVSIWQRNTVNTLGLWSKAYAKSVRLKYFGTDIDRNKDESLLWVMQHSYSPYHI